MSYEFTTTAMYGIPLDAASVDTITNDDGCVKSMIGIVHVTQWGDLNSDNTGVVIGGEPVDVDIWGAIAPVPEWSDEVRDATNALYRALTGGEPPEPCVYAMTIVY